MSEKRLYQVSFSGRIANDVARFLDIKWASPETIDDRRHYRYLVWLLDAEVFDLQDLECEIQRVNIKEKYKEIAEIDKIKTSRKSKISEDDIIDIMLLLNQLDRKTETVKE